jgi:glycosyltransferase involved in cell wall biosynthesis
MHVAFVTPEFTSNGRLYPGGLANYLHVTARALKDRGDKATVVTLSDRNAESLFDGIRVVEVAHTSPLLFRPAIKLLSMMAPGAAFHLVVAWSLNRALRRLLEREKIDVVQYTNWKSVGLFRVGKPSLLRISSYERLWDNNPEKTNLDKRLCRWLESTALKRFSTIIGPGQYLASIIKSDLGLPDEIRIVPTPVAKIVAPSDRNFKVDGKRLVMYAGTLSRIKGADLLLETIDLYLTRHEDTVFLLAGKAGSSKGRPVRQDIEALSHRHPGGIVHHVDLGKADLMAAYSQADLVLIPSLIDNFPNTALEAASQGALLMASDTASLDSLLSNCENALVMNTRSPEDWTEAIAKALTMEPAVSARMKQEMRLRLSTHEPANAVSDLCAVYAEVAGLKSPHTS